MMAKVRYIDAFRQCGLKYATALPGLDIATVYCEFDCLQTRIQNITNIEVQRSQDSNRFLDFFSIFAAKMLDTAQNGIWCGTAEGTQASRLHVFA